MTWQEWEASVPEQGSPSIQLTDEEAEELNKMLDEVMGPFSEDELMDYLDGDEE